ncbi:MAG: TIGR00730 family Rossman fold protein [Pseudomonadota bacterium]
MSVSSLSICVFCGSRPGVSPEYTKAAELLGKSIAARGWRLVYGAGDVGLMGSVARSAQNNGAETFGVIPEHLVNREVGKRDLHSFIVTETMHERKKVMFMNSDAFVIFPGGAGTLDEFFEILTWAQLGLHSKPILVVGIDGFWDPLLALLDHVVAQGFAAPSLLEFVKAVPDVPEALSVLDGLRP